MASRHPAAGREAAILHKLSSDLMAAVLNETGDTQVELMGGEGGSGSVLDSFEDGDYRVPLDYRG